MFSEKDGFVKKVEEEQESVIRKRKRIRKRKNCKEEIVIFASVSNKLVNVRFFR